MYYIFTVLNFWLIDKSGMNIYLSIYLIISLNDQKTAWQLKWEMLNWPALPAILNLPDFDCWLTLQDTRGPYLNPSSSALWHLQEDN